MQKTSVVFAMALLFSLKSLASFSVLLSGDDGFTMHGIFNPNSAVFLTSGTVEGTINEEDQCEGGHYDASLGLFNTTLTITFPEGSCPSTSMSFKMKTTQVTKLLGGSPVNVSYSVDGFFAGTRKGRVQMMDR
jgi:hypothetical protein